MLFKERSNSSSKNGTPFSGRIDKQHLVLETSFAGRKPRSHTALGMLE